MTKRAQKVVLNSVPIGYLGLQSEWSAMHSIGECWHLFLTSLLWSLLEKDFDSVLGCGHQRNSVILNSIMNVTQVHCINVHQWLFAGLSLLEAKKLSSYFHFTEPVNLKNKTLLEKADLDPSTDFLDSLEHDIPRGKGSKINRCNAREGNREVWIA